MNAKGLRTLKGGIPLLALMSIILIDGADALDPPERICLIMVSGATGYSSSEMGRAISFYDHCVDDDGIDEGNIVFLADPNAEDTDGPANLSNIEEAFEWLYANSGSNTKIIIYISDHQLWSENQAFFVFEGGNLSASTLDGWIDGIAFDRVTLVLNGERSALGGQDLTGSNRDIICSMGSGQFNIPDLFNITRSLEDPEADLDDDSDVSYVEAYLKEIENLIGTGQDPFMY